MARKEKNAHEFGRIRIGQKVFWNKLEFAPSNVVGPLRHFYRIDGKVEEHTPSFDVSMIGRVIDLNEVETGCWATVELESGATRSMHIQTDGCDRGGFGSLRVLKDCFQMEIAA